MRRTLYTASEATNGWCVERQSGRNNGSRIAPCWIFAAAAACLAGLQSSFQSHLSLHLVRFYETMQDYDRIMGTNLEATYALCQVMQPLLVAGAGWQQQQQPGASGSSSSLPDPIARAGATPEGDACIIFISSVAGGPLAGRSGSLYAASKAGLNHLAASFACEWAAQGIRVNSVAPWVTLTELGQQV